MDAFTIKLLILGGSALVLFRLAQGASSASEVAALPPEFVPPDPSREEPNPPAVTGRDIPFPFDVRELEAELASDARRPRVVEDGRVVYPACERSGGLSSVCGAIGHGFVAGRQ